jgi:hypothetical protein
VPKVFPGIVYSFGSQSAERIASSSKFQVPSFKFEMSLRLVTKLGTWNLELGTWNLEPGTWNLV